MMPAPASAATEYTISVFLLIRRTIYQKEKMLIGKCQFEDTVRLELLKALFELLMAS